MTIMAGLYLTAVRSNTFDITVSFSVETGLVEDKRDTSAVDIHTF